MIRAFFIVLVAALALTAGCASQPVSRTSTTPLQAVDRVDLERYAGLWHEFARLPNSFERGCEGVTAEYRQRDDGLLSVVNTCRKGAPDGEKDVATGRARIVNEGGSKLKVSFFGPFWGDYWIIDLDPSYRWALIGEPSGRYFWILTRQPIPSDALRADLLRRAAALGYPIDRLEFPRQPPAA